MTFTDIDSIDIQEDAILAYDPELMAMLLKDHTTGQNIIWACADYKHLGEGFAPTDQITAEKITGQYGSLIRPRATKAKATQKDRTRNKAEVFTPSWVCNAQNNLIDEAWFGRSGVFNTENPDHTWTVQPDPITFPARKGWKNYVQLKRMEITCGEAPYLASRYDTTTGHPIPVAERIGLLDRKLRVVSENVDDHQAWLRWVQCAFKNTYGYEWQGDNLLIARETLLQTFLDYHAAKFGADYPLQRKSALYIAYIISWNLWQMDGLKGVVPLTCGWTNGIWGQEPETCVGCKTGDNMKHNGKYCKIKDWGAKKIYKYKKLLK